MDTDVLLERAKRYRQIAASVSDQPTKQGLLDLAGRYEAVAREDEGSDAFPDREL